MRALSLFNPLTTERAAEEGSGRSAAKVVQKEERRRIGRTQQAGLLLDGHPVGQI